jgi:hypothetical protein
VKKKLSHLLSIMRKSQRAFRALMRLELRAARTALLLTLTASIVLSVLLVNFAREDKKVEAEKLPVLSVAGSIVDEDDSALGQILAAYLEDLRYISAVYYDTMDQALERLEADETIVILRLPPTLFEETRTGSQREPVEMWLNPRKPAESGQASLLVRQYASVLDYLYGTIFGYQKVYVELGGDENDSWNEATRHSMNVLVMYFGRYRYAETGDFHPYNVLLHTYSAFLIVFALLPAMGVLAGTSRLAGTSYEDRLLLSSGPASMMAARLASGLLWWLVLLVPLLLALKISGLLAGVFPVAAILLAAYFTTALIMLALGRIKVPGISIMLTGWLTFLIMIVLGGVIYPTSIFPEWLNRGAAFTPIYPMMQFLYNSLYQQGTAGASDLLSALWPLLPAAVIAVIFGRRRV